MPVSKTTVNFGGIEKISGKDMYKIRIDNKIIKLMIPEHIADYLYRHDKSEPIEFFWSKPIVGKLVLLSIKKQDGKILSTIKGKSSTVFGGLFIYFSLMYFVLFFVTLFPVAIFLVLYQESGGKLGVMSWTLGIFGVPFIPCFLAQIRPYKRFMKSDQGIGKDGDIRKYGEEIFG